MKKTIISLLYIGFTLGFILGIILTSVIATIAIADNSMHLYTNEFLEFIGNPLTALLIHSFVCGILGMIILGSALLYEIDKWGLLKATIIHFIVIVVSFYSIAFFLRWFEPTDSIAVGTSLVMFIVIYTGIWLVQYLSYKIQIKEINQKLNIKKMSQNNIGI